MGNDITSADEIRAARIVAQGLARRDPRESLLDVVHTVVGINAQFGPALALSLRARVKSLAVSDIYDMLDTTQTAVRTWAMRGTLHLLAAQDVGWITTLLGPIMIAGGARRRKELGLDDEITRRGAAALHDILATSGPLNRDDIVIQLAQRGVKLDRKTQAPVHLIGYAAHSGLIVQGPDDEKGKPTYAARDKWIKVSDEALSENDASARLASRYLAGYGPASLSDFTAWSGLPKKIGEQGWKQAQADQGWQEVRINNRSLWRLPSNLPPTQTVVNLLPAFDAYVLGYKDREELVAKQHHKDVYHGGQTVPVVMVNGQAAGVWRYEWKGKRLEISVRAFDKLSAEAMRLIHEEADDIGRLWNMPVSMVL